MLELKVQKLMLWQGRRSMMLSSGDQGAGESATHAPPELSEPAITRTLGIDMISS